MSLIRNFNEAMMNQQTTDDSEMRDNNEQIIGLWKAAGKERRHLKQITVHSLRWSPLLVYMSCIEQALFNNLIFSTSSIIFTVLQPYPSCDTYSKYIYLLSLTTFS